MGENSSIEWTHHTFNPWWGCTKVSPGCAHCYAETFSKRTGNDVWGKDAPRRFFGDKHWYEPLKWAAEAAVDGVRRRVFCASMADVFEDRADLVPHRARLFTLIAETPWLDWLLLTKRPGNWRKLVMEVLRHFENSPIPRVAPFRMPMGYHLAVQWAFGDAPRNVWVGTTVEDQVRADERIPLLLDVPARVRFLSCEPLLGPVDLNTSEKSGPMAPVDWVICGGESGSGASPMHPDWARVLRDQCQENEVPFFFKQWGEWLPAKILDDSRFMVETRVEHPGPKRPEFLHWCDVTPGDRNVSARVGKKAGRVLDERTWDEVPTISEPHNNNNNANTLNS